VSRAVGRADPRRRRERGAISFATPVVLLSIALPVLALAIDVGRLAWDKRQLQEIADLGAIDAMRAFGQCTENAGDPVAAAQASAVRNGYDGNLAAAPNKVEIGSVTRQAGGVREFTAGGTAATATAVRVFATRQVPFTMIASAIMPGEATLQVEAVAARKAVAGIEAAASRRASTPAMGGRSPRSWADSSAEIPRSPPSRTRASPTRTSSWAISSRPPTWVRSRI